MTKHAAKPKIERGYFATKSIVSKSGATMKVFKLELTSSASEQLKANSYAINAGTTKSSPKESAVTS